MRGVVKSGAVVSRVVDRGRLACGGPRASRPPRVARVVGRTAGQRPAVHWSASRWTRARWLAVVSRVVDRGRLARLGWIESLDARRARGPRSTGWRAGRVCWRPAVVSRAVDRGRLARLASESESACRLRSGPSASRCSAPPRPRGARSERRPEARGPLVGEPVECAGGLRASRMWWTAGVSPASGRSSR